MKRRTGIARLCRANRAEQCRLFGVDPADICSMRVLRILTDGVGEVPEGPAAATSIQNNSGRP